MQLDWLLYLYILFKRRNIGFSSETGFEKVYVHIFLQFARSGTQMLMFTLKSVDRFVCYDSTCNDTMWFCSDKVLSSSFESRCFSYDCPSIVIFKRKHYREVIGGFRSTL